MLFFVQVLVWIALVLHINNTSLQSYKHNKHSSWRHLTKQQLTTDSFKSFRAFSNAAKSSDFVLRVESDLDEPSTRLPGLGVLLWWLQLCTGTDLSSALRTSWASFWGGTCIALPWTPAWKVNTNVPYISDKSFYLAILSYNDEGWQDRNTNVCSLD